MTIELAPSGQKSINSFNANSDKDIVRPGETYICAGIESKRGSYKRKYTLYLKNPKDSDKKTLSELIIGSKNTIPLRDFGFEEKSTKQVWGEIPTSDKAIRFELSSKGSEPTGSLKIYNSKGDTTIYIRKLLCKKRV